MSDPTTESFFDAIRANDRDKFVTALKSSRATPDWLDSHCNDIRYASWFSGLGATLLQITSFLRPELAPLLRERGATLDLHSACALGEIETVRQIVGSNPDTADQTVDGCLPIQFALRHPPVLRALLELGSDPNQPIKRLAWFDWEDQASERGLSDWRLIHMVALGRGDEPHIASAEVLKEFGADLRAYGSPFGDTALHLAAIYNRTHLIHWFVDNGVPVDIATADKGTREATAGLFDTKPFEPFESCHDQTPLMVALGEGQTDATNLLLELEADVHSRDSKGFTPLHYAAAPFWQENLASLERLVDLGAKVDAKDAGGRLAIELARAKGYDTTASFLGEFAKP